MDSHDDRPPYFELTSLDQLKALADPLRRRLLGAMAKEPVTTKQVARRIGESASKLYHHVDVLAEAGLLTLVETRQNRGAVEKYYQTVAIEFTISPELLRMAPQADEIHGNIQAMVVDTLQSGLADAAHLLNIQRVREETGDEVFAPITITHKRLRLSPEQVRELTTQFKSWIEAAEDAHVPDDGFEYTLTVTFFPLDDSASDTPSNPDDPSPADVSPDPHDPDQTS